MADRPMQKWRVGRDFCGCECPVCFDVQGPLTHDCGEKKCNGKKAKEASPMPGAAVSRGELLDTGAIGALFRIARVACGLSLRDCAARLSVDDVTMGAFERGTEEPNCWREVFKSLRAADSSGAAPCPTPHVFDKACKTCGTPSEKWRSRPAALLINDDLLAALICGSKCDEHDLMSPKDVYAEALARMAEGCSVTVTAEDPEPASCGRGTRFCRVIHRSSPFTREAAPDSRHEQQGKKE
jgi:hypothetical protein